MQLADDALELPPVAPRQNYGMRFLIGVLVGAALLFGVYHFGLLRLPASDDNTAATQAVSLTGVRMDLLEIADAEHGYIAINGECVRSASSSPPNPSMTRTGRTVILMKSVFRQ